MPPVGPSLGEVAAAKLREAKKLVRRERAFDAERVASDAEALFEKISDSNGALRAFLLFLSAKIVDERLDDALTLAKAKLEKAKQTDDVLAESLILVSLVEVHVARGSPAEALEIAKEAEEYLLALDDKQSAGELLMHVASAHLAQGSAQASLNASLQAVDLFSKCEDGEGESAAWCGVINARLALGRYDDALRAAEAALVVSSDSHDELGQAMALLSIARAHHETGQCQKGRKAAEKALKLFKLEGSDVLAAQAMDTYVSAMINLKLGPEALKFCKSEVALVLLGRDKRAVPALRNCLVRLYSFLDKKKLALVEAENALAAAEELGSTKLQAVSLRHVAHMNLLLGKTELARQYATKCAGLCKEQGDMVGEAIANEILGKTVEHRGVFEEKAEREREAEVLVQRLVRSLEDMDGDEFKTVLRTCFQHDYVFTEDVEEAIGPVLAQNPETLYQFYLDNQPDEEEYRVDKEDKTFDNGQMFERRLMYFICRLGQMGYGPGFRLCKDFWRLGEQGDQSVGFSALDLMEHAPDWEEQAGWHPGILDCALQTGAPRHMDFKLNDRERVN
eukprot:TRINITY_DN76036_c0_g1_i1.p1 TRINITY_DN76036_c0_g1~~TRINITY_DN76036_c0_g1_i1.p1  ORF type:complete len:565 (+),score=134.21 TRINITY_DN76036_c0_g1_i1:38-1732(+)